MSANDAPTTDFTTHAQAASRTSATTDVRQTASYASMRRVMDRFA